MWQQVLLQMLQQVLLGAPPSSPAPSAAPLHASPLRTSLRLRRRRLPAAHERLTPCVWQQVLLQMLQQVLL